MELFNLNNYYNTRQSRIRKLLQFSYSRNPHRLFAMLVLSPSFFIDFTLQPKSKAKFRISMFYVCLHHFYGPTCVLKIKELLRNF